MSQASGVQTIEKESAKRTEPMSFAIRTEVKARLKAFRDEGGIINVSQICNEAIERELERQLDGNRVVERLKLELKERRGPEWTAGYQEGRNWAEERGSWQEITELAIRYGPEDVEVYWNRVGDLGEPGAYEFEWLSFSGRFNAPAEDYGQDTVNTSGAPAYKQGVGPDGKVVWQYDEFRCQRFWRGWLAAVKEVYAMTERHLPSLEDQLPPLPEPTAVVNTDEIPF